jgi:phosphate transport system protein
VSIFKRLIARKASREDIVPKGTSGSAMTQGTVKAAGPSSMPHTVASFDEDLKVLGNMIADMGMRACRSLGDATRALLECNTALAQQVIAADHGLDLLQHEIEEKAVSTLARRQPVAVDLREVVSAMRIAGDLERIGDLAKNVAKRVVAVADQPSPANLATGLAPLSERAGEQLSTVLKAYADRDDAAALAVWRADGEIDVMLASLFRKLLTYMMEDPRSIGYGTHLLFCAKNLERIGDHATNIAETAHYMITGEVLIAERPKGDGSSAIDPSLRSPQT